MPLPIIAGAVVLLETALAFFAAWRVRAAVWAAAHPWLAGALTWLGFGDLITELTLKVQQWKAEGIETADESRQAILEFFESGMATGLDAVRYSGHFWAIQLNEKLGLQPGDEHYLTTVAPDDLLAWLDRKIRSEIEHAGGQILSGQMVAGIRGGWLPAGSWANRVHPVDPNSVNAVALTLGDAALRKRLQNRERQRRYRQTHRRKSHWIKK